MLGIVDSSGRIRQDVLDNPYALYDWLRAQEPVHFDESLGGWMLTRHSDVRAALVDPRLSSERTQAYLSELPSVDRDRFQRFVDTRGDMLLFCDGAKHKRVRQAVVGAMRSIDYRPFRALIQQRADELLDEIGTTEFDLIGEFALPFPIAVLLDLLGIPNEDAAIVRSWATAFNMAIGGVIRPDLVEAAQVAVEEVSAYLDDLLGATGTASPLLDHLRKECEAERITPLEMHASCLMLITAGHETVSNLIGNSLFALLRNPDQLRWLRSSPGSVFGALDELIRFEAPVQLTAREAKVTLSLGDKEIEMGQRVIPIWGAANRDPEIFPEPNRLDLERSKASRQLGFGSGRHRCIGVSLARLEADIALTTLIERFPRVELTEPPAWKENFSFRGLQRLPVVVAAA